MHTRSGDSQPKPFPIEQQLLFPSARRTGEVHQFLSISGLLVYQFAHIHGRFHCRTLRGIQRTGRGRLHDHIDHLLLCILVALNHACSGIHPLDSGLLTNH